MRLSAFACAALVTIVANVALSDRLGAASLPGDPQAFTEAFVALCRQAAPNLELEIVGPLSLRMKTQQGVVDTHLDTVYAACQRDPTGCGDFLDRMVGLTAKGFASPRQAATLSRVRVTVRPSSYIDQLTAGDDTPDPVAEPLAGDLWVIGVSDLPTSIASLDQTDLKALKLDAAAALAAGKRNIEAEFGAGFRAGVANAQPGAGVGGMRGNDYLSSLLALPELWTPLADRFGGQLYVAAPASDYVIYADARVKGNAAEMARVAAEIAQVARRPVSTEIFEWTPTGWGIVDPAKAR